MKTDALDRAGERRRNVPGLHHLLDEDAGRVRSGAGLGAAVDNDNAQAARGGRPGAGETRETAPDHGNVDQHSFEASVRQTTLRCKVYDELLPVKWFARAGPPSVIGMAEAKRAVVVQGIRYLRLGGSVTVSTRSAGPEQQSPRHCRRCRGRRRQDG